MPVPTDTSAATASRALGPMLAFIAFGMYAGCWAALLPALRDNADASAAVLGLALLAASVGALPAMLVTGPALDRYGSRVLGLGLVALAGATYLTSFAGSAPALVVSLLVVGLAGGATDIAMNGEVAHVEARSGRPLMNLAHACFSIGAVIGGAATGVAREQGMSAPAITAGLAVCLLLVATRNRDSAPAPALGAPEAAAARRGPLVTRHLVALGVLVGLSFVVEATAFSWSAIHMEDTLRASPGVAGFAVATYFAGSVTGRIAAHLRGAAIRPIVLLVGSGILITISAAAVSASPTAGPAIVAFFVLGLGTATVAPTLYAIAGAAGGERRGAAIATVAMLGYVGDVAGPAASGFIASATSLRVSFAVLAAVGVVLAVGGAAVLRGRPRTAPDEHVGTAPDHNVRLG